MQDREDWMKLLHEIYALIALFTTFAVAEIPTTYDEANDIASSSMSENEEDTFCREMYQKHEDEDENDYYTRILKRFDYECDDAYVKRMDKVEKLFPDLKIWNDMEFINYTQPYYSVRLKSNVNESESEFLNRILQKPDWYTDKDYTKLHNFVNEYLGLKNQNDVEIETSLQVRSIPEIDNVDSNVRDIHNNDEALINTEVHGNTDNIENQELIEAVRDVIEPLTKATKMLLRKLNNIQSTKNRTNSESPIISSDASIETNSLRKSIQPKLTEQTDHTTNMQAETTVLTDIPDVEISTKTKQMAAINDKSAQNKELGNELTTSVDYLTPQEVETTVTYTHLDSDEGNLEKEKSFSSLIGAKIDLEYQGTEDHQDKMEDSIRYSPSNDLVQGAAITSDIDFEVRKDSEKKTQSSTQPPTNNRIQLSGNSFAPAANLATINGGIDLAVETETSIASDISSDNNEAIIHPTSDTTSSAVISQIQPVEDEKLPDDVVITLDSTIDKGLELDTNLDTELNVAIPNLGFNKLEMSNQVKGILEGVDYPEIEEKNKVEEETHEHEENIGPKEVGNDASVLVESEMQANILPISKTMKTNFKNIQPDDTDNQFTLVGNVNIPLDLSIETNPSDIESTEETETIVQTNGPDVEQTSKAQSTSGIAIDADLTKHIDTENSALLGNVAVKLGQDNHDKMKDSIRYRPSNDLVQDAAVTSDIDIELRKDSEIKTQSSTQSPINNRVQSSGNSFAPAQNFVTINGGTDLTVETETSIASDISSDNSEAIIHPTSDTKSSAVVSQSQSVENEELPDDVVLSLDKTIDKGLELDTNIDTELDVSIPKLGFNKLKMSNQINGILEGEDYPKFEDNNKVEETHEYEENTKLKEVSNDASVFVESEIEANSLPINQTIKTNFDNVQPDDTDNQLTLVGNVNIRPTVDLSIKTNPSDIESKVETETIVETNVPDVEQTSKAQSTSGTAIDADLTKHIDTDNSALLGNVAVKLGQDNRDEMKDSIRHGPSNNLVQDAAVTSDIDIELRKDSEITTQSPINNRVQSSGNSFAPAENLVTINGGIYLTVETETSVASDISSGNSEAIIHPTSDAKSSVVISQSQSVENEELPDDVVLSLDSTIDKGLELDTNIDTELDVSIPKLGFNKLKMSNQINGILEGEDYPKFEDNSKAEETYEYEENTKLKEASNDASVFVESEIEANSLPINQTIKTNFDNVQPDDTDNQLTLVGNVNIRPTVDLSIKTNPSDIESKVETETIVETNVPDVEQTSKAQSTSGTAIDADLTKHIDTENSALLGNVAVNLGQDNQDEMEDSIRYNPVNDLVQDTAITHSSDIDIGLRKDSKMLTETSTQSPIDSKIQSSGNSFQLSGNLESINDGIDLPVETETSIASDISSDNNEAIIHLTSDTKSKDVEKELQITEETIKELYKRLESESNMKYKRRIYERRPEETDNQYINRINKLRNLFPDSEVWHEDEGLTYSSEYYQLISIQGEEEETDEFYLRLVDYLEGEDDASYVIRLDYIKELYPDLSLWYDDKYLDLIEPYYTLKYTKHEDETDHDYFVRILQQDEDESNESYVRRVSLISKIFPDLDVWNNMAEIDLTRNYYSILFRKYLGESPSTYYNRIMYQGLHESPDDYVNRISFIRSLFPELDLWTEPKYLIYTSKYYRQMYRQLPEESLPDYYSRIFDQNDEESESDYVARIKIISSIFTNLKPIFNNPEYLEYTRNYYEQIYDQKENETDEAYKIRVFRQGAKEGNIEFVDKMKLLNELYPDLEIWNNLEDVRFTRRYFLDVYKRNPGENDDEYYRRLMYQGFYESNDHYENRIRIVQAVLPNLDLWLNVKYIPYTAKYYKYAYRMKESDDTDAFLKNIFTRQPKETRDDYVKRIFILRQVFNLEIDSLFDNPQALEYTKEYYRILYGRQKSESVSDYAIRTFTHSPDESDSEFVGRIKIVMTLFPNVEFWNNEDYLYITRSFYELYFEISEDETEDEYYKRMFTREDEESDVDYYKRIAFFQIIKPDLLCWEEDSSYHFYTTVYLELQVSMGIIGGL